MPNKTLTGIDTNLGNYDFPKGETGTSGSWVSPAFYTPTGADGSTKTVLLPDGTVPEDRKDQETITVLFMSGSITDKVSLSVGTKIYKFVKNPLGSDAEAGKTKEELLLYAETVPIGKIPVGCECTVKLDGTYAIWLDAAAYSKVDKSDISQRLDDSAEKVPSNKAVWDELSRPEYRNKVVTVEKVYTGDYYASDTADEIRNFSNGGGTVSLQYEDQVYDYQGFRGGVAVFYRATIDAETAEGLEITVDHTRLVNVTRKGFEGGVKIDDTGNNRITTLSSRESANRFANALTAKKEGLLIPIFDSSPNIYDMHIHGESKNLIYEQPGTFVDLFVYRLYRENKRLPPGTYTVSAKSVESDSERPYIIFQMTDGQYYTVWFTRQGTSVSDFKEVINLRYVTDQITVYAGKEKKGTATVVDLQVEKGDAKTEFANYVEIQNTPAIVMNQNMLNPDVFLENGFEVIEHSKGDYYQSTGSVVGGKTIIGNPVNATGTFWVNLKMGFDTVDYLVPEKEYGLKIKAVYKDGTVQYIKLQDNLPPGVKIITRVFYDFSVQSIQGKTVDRLEWAYDNPDTITKIRDFQIVYSDDKPEIYQPYEQHIFFPDAQGNITLSSLYPNMTVTFGRSDVIQNVVYQKDIIKAFEEQSARITALEAAATNI